MGACRMPRATFKAEAKADDRSHRCSQGQDQRLSRSRPTTKVDAVVKVRVVKVVVKVVVEVKVNACLKRPSKP